MEWKIDAAHNVRGGVDEEQHSGVRSMLRNREEGYAHGLLVPPPTAHQRNDQWRRVLPGLRFSSHSRSL